MYVERSSPIRFFSNADDGRRHSYDLFVSYAPVDELWIESQLLPRLQAARLRVLTPADLEAGAPRLVNIERAVDQCRHTLAVMTPAWLAHAWSDFEALLAASSDPAGRQRRLIPLLLQPCAIPPRMAMLTHADFTDPTRFAENMQRLLKGLGVRAQIFISYKRNVAPDEPLALHLRTALAEAGHRVFMDQTLAVGVEWAREIHRQIEQCDYLVVLLSQASVNSEMVAEEVAHAHAHYQKSGKARLLPVRVNYTESLPYQLSHYLHELQYAAWTSEDDANTVAQQLLDAIRQFSDLRAAAAAELTPAADSSVQAAPKPYADPRFIETLFEPGGAVRPRAEFYVERAGDDLLRRELAKPHGTTTTIRAARQAGKSSLLVRGVAQARQQGSHVVYLDLQPLEPATLASLDTFLRHFATSIVTQLRLDPAQVDKAWRGGLGAPDKTTYLLEDYVFPAVDGQIVLAVDEADRLLGASFQDTFFGLLRSWHNNRALNEQWENLDIVLVISTEPHLLIQDVTQSPFNVGQKIRLDDFDAAQVQALNERYRQPLGDAELPDFMAFLGGHPYLSHKALYTLVTADVTWPALKAAAVAGDHSFGDHLRRYLWQLLRPARSAARSSAFCTTVSAAMKYFFIDCSRRG
ncbi:MAG: AAA-like domain-containing protein [Caldilineaceae bacterium]